MFAGLGTFDYQSALNGEFDTLVGLATEVKNETIAADAIQIAADAAAVAAIWSFGLGMAAFLALEAVKQIDEAVISSKSKELNDKLGSIDIDIAAKIGPSVNNYVTQYKANNNLIASKATKGMDTRECRAVLMQFLAQVQKENQTLNPTLFKKYAHSARILYNSTEIQAIYDGLDKINLSNGADADVKALFGTIKGLPFDTTTMSVIQNFAIAIMLYKLKVANTTITESARAAGLEPAEVDSSLWGMMDAVGKFVAVVAVVMSVINVVMDVIAIVDVVKQADNMCSQLNGTIKDSYNSYFSGIQTASQAYNTAVAAAPKP